VSTRIVWDPEDDIAVLYDSVSGVAFGEDGVARGAMGADAADGSLTAQSAGLSRLRVRQWAGDAVRPTDGHTRLPSPGTGVVATAVFSPCLAGIFRTAAQVNQQRSELHRWRRCAPCVLRTPQFPSLYGFHENV
jgi:hypothetical protein